jgi:hypothetical protein
MPFADDSSILAPRLSRPVSVILMDLDIPVSLLFSSGSPCLAGRQSLQGDHRSEWSPDLQSGRCRTCCGYCGGNCGLRGVLSSPHMIDRKGTPRPVVVILCVGATGATGAKVATYISTYFHLLLIKKDPNEYTR